MRPSVRIAASARGGDSGPSSTTETYLRAATVTLNGMVGRRSSPASGPPSSDGGRELYCPRQPKLPMIDLRLTSQRWRVDLGFTFKQLVVPPGSANCPLSRWVGASSCVKGAQTHLLHIRQAACRQRSLWVNLMGSVPNRRELLAGSRRRG